MSSAVPLIEMRLRLNENFTNLLMIILHIFSSKTAWQVAFTLKLNCKYAIKNCSRCYYLRTRNASLEWIPCRSIVHQIVRDLEISILKKGVLQRFANFSGNQLCRSVFFRNLQVWGLRPTILWKERLRYCCFSVNFAKSLTTAPA